MRIKGLDASKPNMEVCIFPRKEGNIVITAKAVLSYDRFEELIKKPILDLVTLPSGEKESTPEFEQKFEVASAEYSAMRIGFMLFESLRDNECIEWDNISPDNPTSWKNIQSEIENLPLTIYEKTRLNDAINKANGISDELVEEAEKSFLENLAQKVNQPNTQNTEAVSSTLGEPVKGSGLDLQTVK